MTEGLEDDIAVINKKEEKIKHIEEITSIQSTIYDVFRKINELVRAVNMLMDKKDEVHQLKIDLFELINNYEWIQRINSSKH